MRTDNYEQLAALVKVQRKLETQLAEIREPFETQIATLQEACRARCEPWQTRLEAAEGLLAEVRAEILEDYRQAAKHYWDELCAGRPATLPELPKFLRAVNRKELVIEDEKLVPEEFYVRTLAVGTLKKLTEAAPGTRFDNLVTLNLYKDEIV